MNRKDYTAALRRVADVLDAHPELDHEIYPSAAWVFCHEPADFVRYVRAFGAGGKEFKGEDLEFAPEYCGEVFRVNCKREQICERKVVGRRQVPERRIPEQVIPAHEEDIVEWDCKPVLAKRPAGGIELPRPIEGPLTSVNPPDATQSEACATAQPAVISDHDTERTERLLGSDPV